jgi:hypothetical protein
MKLEVLIAQIIFAFIGLFFIGMAAVGVFSGEHYTGLQPVVGVFIGLPFIAIVALLDRLHRKNDAQKI